MVASDFRQNPTHGGHPYHSLTVPTAKPVVDFHHQVITHAGRTQKTQKDEIIFPGFSDVIPAAGVEPARPCGHWILSPARLPIPPRRHDMKNAIFHLTHGKAVTGFEPVIEVLQTCALPLGYTAEVLLFEKNWASWIRTNE